MLLSLALSVLACVPQAGRAPASGLRTELGALALREATSAELEAGLQRLGREGTLGDIELAVMLAARIEEPQLDGQLPRGERALRDAASAVFARHALKLPRLGTLLGERGQPWRATLIAAVGDSRTPQAVARLGEWLGQADDNVRDTVAALSQAARSLQGPFDERARAAVRSLLDRPGRPGHREAVLCVGWLEDDEALDALLDLLRSAHPGLAKDAQWSLGRITGAHFGSDPVAWRRWIADEREWRLEVLPGALDDLLGDNAGAQARALNEIARHRFPRHELATRLSARLSALDGDRFTCACAALGELGSSTAGEALRQASEQDRPENERLAAAGALARIAGRASRR